MKKTCYIFFILVLGTLAIYAQNDSTAFKPSGRIIARAFADYSTDFDENSGFDLTRAFLGYGMQITPTLSGQIIIDGASGRNDKGNLEVYMRNAFLRWKDKGFEVNAGLTNLLQFSMQEDYWKHRYVMKSFQDLNKMAPSVDMGATGSYTFNSFVSADLSFTNGSGYKNVSKSGSKRYAAGLNIHPIKNSVFRIYADVYNESEGLRDALPSGVANIKYKNQYSLALFAGYQIDLISFGAEYNRVFNKGFIEDKDYYGYSAYASVKIKSKWRVFGRYDWMDSKKPASFTEEWNNLDGQLIMAGIEYRPIKQLKIAPNIRNINPSRDKSEQYLYINVEFNW